MNGCAYACADGREQKEHPGKPEGAIAIADAISANGALAKLDISNNDIPDNLQANLKGICTSKSIDLVL